MSPLAGQPKETTSFLDEIEKKVSEIFSAQKSEVEQTLMERINREKEEAMRRIEAVNQEFAKVRRVLEEHKKVMADLQAAEARVRQQIRGHFDRVMNYQRMMENAAGLASEELERIGGLNEELERIRVRAEQEYASLKSQLAGYAGIASEIPAPFEVRPGDIDWNVELDKLRKVRDLLATLRQVDVPAEPIAEAPAPSPTPSPAPEVGAVSAEEDGLRDDAEFIGVDTGWTDVPSEPGPEGLVTPSLIQEPYDESDFLAAPTEIEPPAAAPAPSAAPSARDEEHERVLETLARYRKNEPINNGLEIGFFASDAGSVLDVESFLAAVTKIVDGAEQLHGQLPTTTSVKDLFLLKQEILNHQEVLRKVLFRVVRFCDKEGGRLPEALSEILSAQGMKDLIERLTMANWSDPSDFRMFLNELRAIKRAFETRAATFGDFHKVLLDQVEGRN